MSKVIQNLGKIIPTHRGTYDPDRVYFVLDEVFYMGTSYRVIKNPPKGTLPTDEEYWVKIVNAQAKLVSVDVINTDEEGKVTIRFSYEDSTTFFVTTGSLIPDNIKSDWNAASGTSSEILNKPNLGNAALANIGNGPTEVAAGNHSHSDSTTSVSGFMSSTDKDKLDGISNGATANYSNEHLLNRANHSGTQEISTVNGLSDALTSKLGSGSIGVAGGIAGLDAQGRVPQSQGGGDPIVTIDMTTDKTPAQIKSALIHNGFYKIAGLAGIPVAFPVGWTADTGISTGIINGYIDSSSNYTHSYQIISGNTDGLWMRKASNASTWDVWKQIAVATLATVTDDGLMSSTDKVKLNSIPEITSNTIIVNNALGNARENKSFTDISGLLKAPYYAATVNELANLDRTKYKAAILVETGKEGTFVARTTDISSILVGSWVAIDAVQLETHTFAKDDHGLSTGNCIVFNEIKFGVSTNTKYYVIVTSSYTFKVATSYANAVNGVIVEMGGGIGAISYRRHYDPAQLRYVTPPADISGASGAWVRTEPANLGKKLGKIQGTFSTVQELLSDNTLTYEFVEVGQEAVGGGYSYEIVSSEEPDPDLTTPNLINLNVKPTQHGYINPEQYGLIGAGGNDHPKIQRALDSGYPVVMPKGYHYISEPLVMTATGQRLMGGNPNDCVIISNSATPHDILRVYGTNTEVSKLFLRGTMSAATSRNEQTAIIRVMAGLVDIFDNRLFSDNAGRGAGIVLDDYDPATGSNLPGGGRYFHNIARNRIGYYEVNDNGIGPFHTAIRAHAWNKGLHATTIENNKIISDRGISIESAASGGESSGNRIYANTIQSATGVYGAQVGVGVNIGTYCYGEVVEKNYIELYSAGIYVQRANDAINIPIGAFDNNLYDNNTQNVATAGARQYMHRDMRSFVDQWNGWNTRYGNSSYVDFFAPGSSTSIRRVHADGAHQIKILAAIDEPTVELTGNDQVITPTSTEMKINGKGAHRTGITIANGTYPGQNLTITASTWGATIDNDGGVGGNQNIAFVGNGSSCAMGNGTGQVGSLTLKWRTGYFGANGAWVEQSRQVRP